MGCNLILKQINSIILRKICLSEIVSFLYMHLIVFRLRLNIQMRMQKKKQS